MEKRDLYFLEDAAAQEVPGNGEAPAEQPKPKKFVGLLKSRKFWAALVALLLIVAKAAAPELELDEGQVTNLVYVVVAYILGTALEDGMRAEKS